MESKRHPLKSPSYRWTTASVEKNDKRNPLSKVSVRAEKAKCVDRDWKSVGCIVRAPLCMREGRKEGRKVNIPEQVMCPFTWHPFLLPPPFCIVGMGQLKSHDSELHFEKLEMPAYNQTWEKFTQLSTYYFQPTKL